MDVIDLTKMLAISAYEWRTGDLGGWKSAKTSDRQDAASFADNIVAIVKANPIQGDIPDKYDITFPSIIKDIVVAGCEVTGMDYDKLMKRPRRRSRSHCVVRRAASWVARNVVYPTPSLQEIAAGVYCGCDHSNVSLHIKNYRDDTEAQHLAREICVRMHLVREYDLAMRAGGLVPMAVA